MDWLDHQTLALLISALSLVGAGIVGYIRLMAFLRNQHTEYSVQMQEQRQKERQQLLRDFQEWYNIAQKSFQEVRMLQLQLQALELHVQRLEHVMREQGIDVPNRPPEVDQNAL